MYDLMEGKKTSLRKMPNEVIEFFIATETGWTLDEIRNLSEKDSRVFSQLAIAYFKNAPRNQRINL